MKRNPNPPRMFCSFFFLSLSHFQSLPLTNTHTQRERREKRDVCAIALIANERAAIQGGVGWGERKGKEYIHTRMAMDGCAALRCNGCAAMERKWVGILLLPLLFLVSCFLLFKERARLIGAAAAAIAGC